MNRSIYFLVVIATLALCCFVPVSQAVDVTNSAGTVLFSDDFEAQTVGLEPGAPPTGLSWAVVDGTAEYAIVTNALLPGAGEGSKYLEMYRLDDTLRVEARFTLQSSGKLVARWSTYIESGDEMQFRLGVGSSTSQTRVLLRLDSESPNVLYLLSSGYQDSGVAYSMGVWQNWVITVDLDTETFTLTIDDTISGDLGFYTTGDISEWISVAGAKIARWYVDAPIVPPPPAGTVVTLR